MVSFKLTFFLKVNTKVHFKIGRRGFQIDVFPLSEVKFVQKKLLLFIVPETEFFFLSDLFF